MYPGRAEFHLSSAEIWCSELGRTCLLISARLRGANVSRERKSEYPPVQLLDISKTDLKHGMAMGYGSMFVMNETEINWEGVSCLSDQAVFIDRV